MNRSFRIAAIGCGDIFRKAYVPGIRAYRGLELVAVADLDRERARTVASEFAIPVSGSVEEILARDDIDAVLNLTVPKAHGAVDRMILEAGRHVYSEKPLALDPAEAGPLLELARSRGLRLACAPDTVLGAGIQTARAAVDAGAIGIPTSATAFMTCPGHEHWHPSPEFYYQAGGGPLLDMGPYYLTALVTLFGPVRRVVALSGRARSERLITSAAKNGTRIPVEVDTHISATLQFHNGALATMIMSFDIHGSTLPRIEVHGTEGSLSVPDPNCFAGTVSRWAPRAKTWEALPVQHAEGRRGLGLADLASAVRSGRPERCSGTLAYHVLETMDACLRAGRSGQAVEVTSTCERPLAVPTGLAADAID